MNPLKTCAEIEIKRHCMIKCQEIFLIYIDIIVRIDDKLLRIQYFLKKITDFNRTKTREEFHMLRVNLRVGATSSCTRHFRKNMQKNWT